MIIIRREARKVLPPLDASTAFVPWSFPGHALTDRKLAVIAY